MSDTRTILAAALAAVALGCSSPDPVNETHTGTLQDGDSVHPDDQSLYDEYPIEVGKGYTITVTMHSTDFDSYIHMHGPQGEGAQDNDSGGGNDARVVHVAENGGRWLVWANSARPGETGSYTLTITTTKPSS